jgi:hypothetical protein
MKANAPEKVYLHLTTGSHILNGKYYEYKPAKIRYNDNIIEYIRKDAFIEKAFEFFGEHLWEYIDVRNANCDTLINIDGDKLKEDFRKYMKGE